MVSIQSSSWTTWSSNRLHLLCATNSTWSIQLTAATIELLRTLFVNILTKRWENKPVTLWNSFKEVRIFYTKPDNCPTMLRENLMKIYIFNLFGLLMHYWLPIHTLRLSVILGFQCHLHCIHIGKFFNEWRKSQVWSQHSGESKRWVLFKIEIKSERSILYYP